MNNPITGLIHVTGEPDTGKTTFALTCGFKPEEICFFDDDLKTKPIADALAQAGTPLGEYYDLTKLSLGMREIEFHDLVIGLVNNLPTGKFKVIVFDTWTRFENTFQPKVQKNPTLFREFYSSMGSIKGAEMWKASFDYEAAIIDKMMQVAPLVMLITHLKDQNVMSVKTGKEIPDCKKPVIEKSRIRIWLHHNPDNPAPIGLVLKRLSKMIMTDGGLEAVNVLPRKVNPCTWQKLLDYWENPIGTEKPSAEETPNDFELSILDGVLTEDQKDILHINRVESDRPRNEESTSAESSGSTSQPMTIQTLMDKHGTENVMKILKIMTGGELPQTQEELRKVKLALLNMELGYDPQPIQVSTLPIEASLTEVGFAPAVPVS